MSKIIPKSKIARIVSILVLLLLFTAAACGVLVWQGNQVLTKCGPLYSEDWPHVDLKVDKEGVKVFTSVLDRHPELKPAWKNVKPEDNGFLHLLQFYEYISGANGQEEDYNIKLSDELRENLCNESINADGLTDVTLYDEVITELGRIAALPASSCAGIDARRITFWNISIRNFNSILTAAAINAAQAGDEAQAYSYMKMAVGVSDHFSNAETVSMMGMTYSIVNRSTIYESVMTDIFPHLDLTKEEYSQWYTMLTVNRKQFTLADMAIGEFNIGMPVSVVPVCESMWLYDIFGANSLYDLMAEYNISLVKLSNKSFPTYGAKEIDALSEESSKKASMIDGLIGDTFYVGISLYAKGIVRCEARFRQFDAALAHLAGEEMPVELLTGKPFLYDKDLNLIYSADDDILYEIDLKPVTLPLMTR